MDRKVVVIAISVFLAVLFISTVGSFYTGYTILQSDIKLSHFPYPFVKNNDYNSLFIVLPNSYTLDEYEAAKDISLGLQFTRPLPPEVVTESNLPEGNHNLILIGDPCTNSQISYYLETNDCNLGLKNGEGIIQLVNNDRTSVLVVSGYDTSSIRKAAKVLAKHNSFPLKNNRIVVSGGNLQNPYSFLLKYN
ncbi:MAG TPA: cellulose biosynthesis cyclic di-GMP-binding regulatory protein BcsB [Candidatus Nanoarchaeia archaeon]|nr:cellulose biosynthesis cyclic di-GMP-binding regulatory protein BcsB [Candidatus Nanoarchaeia archaeon]